MKFDNGELTVKISTIRFLGFEIFAILFLGEMLLASSNRFMLPE